MPDQPKSETFALVAAELRDTLVAAHAALERLQLEATAAQLTQAIDILEREAKLDCSPTPSA